MKRLPILIPTLIICLTLLTSMGRAQSFTNFGGTLGDGFNSGGCVGVADMDGDGLDDVIILDQSTTLYIAYQESNGTYSLESYGSVSSSRQWGACIADIDGNGHKDFFSGGSFDGVFVEYIESRGVSSSVELNTDGGMFMQACNIVDIDNDGNLDIFGCDDVALSNTWKNDGSGNLSIDYALMDLDSYDPGTFTNTDHSGNYGTVWSDFDDDGDVDLYIAKCRQGVGNAQDPRRINQLWVNDGNGNYTEQAASKGLVLFEQSWTADFADIDNDGDMDCLVTNHTGTMMMLENDGTGNYTDVTATAGIGIPGFFLQAKMEDLDNDGYVDILYSGGLDGYYHNDGDGTFTAQNIFTGDDTMHSFAMGDLNDDGFIDVYASYGSIYVNPDFGNDDRLWLNDGNNNNWISFDLEGIFSNKDAVGAKVKIFGDWGVQVREVRAGESYGITNSSKCHFGLGQSNSVTSATIIWPSGEQTTIDNPEINTVHSILEAPCLVQDVSISPNDNVGFCPGASVELSAPAGFEEYIWSNGETDQSISVSEAGNYSLIVTNDLGCVGQSETINVDEVVPSDPNVEVIGDLVLCQGSSVILSASGGEVYEWSTGESEADLEVSEAGNYSVAVTDICGNQNTSESFEVEVLAAPAPIVNDQNIGIGESATFLGDDSDLLWYDDELSSDPIAIGPELVTGVLGSTTSYWVENPISYSGVDASGGPTERGNGQHHTNSQNWLLFDIYEDCILKSVKVWADGSEERTIQMIDSNDNVVYEETILIPDGEQVVELNWEVEAGTGYGLRTTDNNPQLWRDDNTNVLNYPYQIGSLGAITSSSITGANQFNYYYFFYDWNLEIPGTDCVSERVEVTAIVGASGCTDPTACNFNPVASFDDGSCEYVCDCAADLNDNGFIGTDDLVILLAELGCNSTCEADIDQNGIVNTGDLTAFLQFFGTTCTD